MNSLLVNKVVIPSSEDELCKIPAQVSGDCVSTSMIACLDFRGYSEYAKGVWTKRFSDSVVSELIGLCFWSCVVDDFQADDARSREIMGFTASRYRRIFESIPNEWKDKFLSKFPDAIAQSVLYSLYLAFPRSRVQFDASYRIKLLRRFCMLIWGYIPVDISTSHWKLLLGDGNVLDSTGSTSIEDDSPNRIERFSPLVKLLVYENRFLALRYIPPTRMNLTRSRSEPKVGFSTRLVDSKKGSFFEELVKLETKLGKEVRTERRRLSGRLRSLNRQEAAKFGEILIAKW